NRVQETVMSHEWALQMHGFYADLEKKTMRFDVVMSFDADKEEAVRILYNELAEIYPEYKIDIVLDADVSDI
ncbi:MAG: cation transporter, partial [Firmicutes bacterium]|nr:cation transporter [Bacillota bacterium]